MTPTYIRLSLFLITLAIFILGVALSASQALPTVTHASLFTANPCALPCLFGVTPGVTLRNDAMVALERQGMSYSFLSQNQSASFTTRESRTSRSTLTLLNFGAAGDMRVTAAYLYQMAQGNELGVLSDFLLAGYQPQRVYADCQNVQRLYIAFEQPLIVQIALGAQFTPNTPIMMVASSHGDKPLEPVGGFACASVSDWRGFAPLWKYQAHS